MTKKIDNKPTIITVLVLLLATFAYIYFYDAETNWDKNFTIQNQEPYSNSILYKLLEEYYPDYEFVESENRIAQELHKKMPNGGLYLFLNKHYSASPKDTDSLLSFVGKGNEAFIISKNTNQLAYLIDSLGANHTYYDAREDSIINMNFIHSALHSEQAYQFEHKIGKELKSYQWSYFSTPNDKYNYSGAFLGYWCDAEGQKYNFLKIKYKKGTFYFHSNPIAFTNFFIRNQQGLEYAMKSFSHFKKGDIYWDKHSKYPDFGENKHKKTPLTYILQQKSLRWAYYLSLFSVLLYLVFNAKRRQRIIPILSKNRNTSVEFAKTIGELYFQQQNHKELASIKVQNFLTFIRQHYYLSIKERDEEFYKHLSQKSEVSLQEIEELFDLIDRIPTKGERSVHFLLKLHQAIEAFYHKCK